MALMRISSHAARLRAHLARLVESVREYGFQNRGTGIDFSPLFAGDLPDDTAFLQVSQSGAYGIICHIRVLPDLLDRQSGVVEEGVEYGQKRGPSADVAYLLLQAFSQTQYDLRELYSLVALLFDALDEELHPFGPSPSQTYLLKEKVV